MNRSTFWMIKYMNGSVFSKARYMNGVGFEILARTPVPKLPLSYPHEHIRRVKYKLVFVAHACSEGPDQSSSRIRVFAVSAMDHRTL